jgi:hypothetical protein
VGAVATTGINQAAWVEWGPVLQPTQLLLDLLLPKWAWLVCLLALLW